jgi:hypothetical protein
MLLKVAVGKTVKKDFKSFSESIYFQDGVLARICEIPFSTFPLRRSACLSSFFSVVRPRWRAS